MNPKFAKQIIKTIPAEIIDNLAILAAQKLNSYIQTKMIEFSKNTKNNGIPAIILLSNNDPNLPTDTQLNISEVYPHPTTEHFVFGDSLNGSDISITDFAAAIDVKELINDLLEEKIDFNALIQPQETEPTPPPAPKPTPTPDNNGHGYTEAHDLNHAQSYIPPTKPEVKEEEKEILLKDFDFGEIGNQELEKLTIIVHKPHPNFKHGNNLKVFPRYKKSLNQLREEILTLHPNCIYKSHRINKKETPTNE